MKLLWLCNQIPSAVQAQITGVASGGLWLDNMLRDLRSMGHTIHILSRGESCRGVLDAGCSYAIFEEAKPEIYDSALEHQFRRELEAFQPDVIHIWGTEYGHTLAMVNAAEALGLLDNTVISIQGLCSVYAGHYAEGVPHDIQIRGTLRDRIRRDNIAQQREKYVLRGLLETKALEKARHIIGRTDWDRACVHAANPQARYHFCNETLREEFFEGSWQYERCTRHHVFASSCAYPVKGFHYLLEAMAEVVKHYPDATISVTGSSFFAPEDIKGKLRQSSYPKYLSDLARKYGLEQKIEFLGGLNAEKMKNAFLNANVFVLPSTIENSPNSLGEAMLLGVPCVASDVGGVSNMLKHGEEGYVYPSTAPYMLAHYIQQVFAMEDRAAALGSAAKAHAQKTHDPRTNLAALLQIYETIAK